MPGAKKLRKSADDGGKLRESAGTPSVLAEDAAIMLRMLRRTPHEQNAEAIKTRGVTKARSPEPAFARLGRGSLGTGNNGVLEFCIIFSSDR
jgi:hypothetical protein